MRRNDEVIILGTRGSALALAQARMVTEALEACVPGISVEQRVIQTVGDKRPDLKLSEFNFGPEPVDKGIFTRELEIALRGGDVDLAVHSLKDVPTELDAGFLIASVLPRAPVEDVLIAKNPGGIDGLPSRACVATSSVRRARQLQWQRPDLKLVDIRGNVATRIEKVAQSDLFDATLLARAGLTRLNLLSAQETRLPEWPQLHASILDPAKFLPAASQGAVGIEIRDNVRESVREAMAAINDNATMQCVVAEREFLHLLQAGCQTPVGVHSRLEGGQLRLSALVFQDDDTGAAPKTGTATGDAGDPRKVANELFQALR